MFAAKAVVSLLTLFLTILSYAGAESPPAPPSAANSTAASTFYYDQTQTQFSLNVANDSSDVFIYFTSPAYSWVAVGFGEKMQNSLMFVMYPSSDGSKVTISPRIATGNSEPSFAKDIKLDVLPGTQVGNGGDTDDMFVLKAVCRNCRSWTGGALDLTSTKQPMIFAFGPGQQLQSDAQDAPLKRHVAYGKFTMNMQTAIGTGGVPAASQSLSGVEIQGGVTKDHDRANLAHAVLGCIAIFILWPLNTIFGGFFRNLKIHIYFSGALMLFLIIAYALGIATSSEYNRSKSFNSPHQVLALVTIIPILAMSILPIPSISKLNNFIPRLHLPMTHITLAFLLITGGLGLSLAQLTRPIILVYCVLSLGMLFLLLLLHTCIWKRGAAHKRGQRSASRGRGVEEDEQDLVLAAYYAGQQVKDQDGRSGSGSSGQVTPPPAYGNPHVPQQQQQQQHTPQNLYGGGSMPGPQYLLNMHPGVPVHKW